MTKREKHFGGKEKACAARDKNIRYWCLVFLLFLVCSGEVCVITAQESAAKPAPPVQQASISSRQGEMSNLDNSKENLEATTPDHATKQEIDPSSYRIGEQDALTITVWKEKDMSSSVVVRPDGKITVPLVGELKVIGLTPLQLQSILAEDLEPFIKVPKVTVAVAEIRSRKVYVIGHTAREGPFMINSSTTVLQLIAQAGGVRDFAKRKKIYILRVHGTEQTRIPFNYDDVIKGKHPEQNVLLEPGDTIVVP
jgi:polysaccharide export outer membrane protein